MEVRSSLAPLGGFAGRIARKPAKFNNSMPRSPLRGVHRKYRDSEHGVQPFGWPLSRRAGCTLATRSLNARHESQGRRYTDRAGLHQFRSGPLADAGGRRSCRPRAASSRPNGRSRCARTGPSAMAKAVNEAERPVVIVAHSLGRADCHPGDPAVQETGGGRIPRRAAGCRQPDDPAEAPDDVRSLSARSAAVSVDRRSAAATTPIAASTWRKTSPRPGARCSSTRARPATSTPIPALDRGRKARWPSRSS